MGTDMSQLLQALKKAFSDGSFSWQRPETDPSPADVLHGAPSDMQCRSFLSDTADNEAARLASDFAWIAR